ncbi:related to Ribosome-releasing factor 2, mitochondrial [Saccharomycodes ludwigii]|uniref:Ribosome-releasing factor 2, mitochondrial n=1 Tax=Saccharomycodes ludwigii TaxID=36035 RepID=A0A376B5K6_9ASCO|nr:related to Ribosome-releasing factor 2, mitochondrial [Saccharomycodes ludwigii]
MLYYSGKTKHIGNVDQGDTVTDFLPQERSRGITIQSAAISFDWGPTNNSNRINLIDTPGHADFTFEVIRSLRILDGCVTILDAVAGVEAQTLKVWKQSAGIPKICFVNKMDRMGASFGRTVKEVVSKLHTRCILINTPVFETKGDNCEFVGVLDTLNKCVLKYSRDDPDKFEVIVDLPESLNEQLRKSREDLVETLSGYDTDLVEYILEVTDDFMEIPADILNNSIRKATLANYVTPILCGASFKNIGVQPLLDAISLYLPSPVETPKQPKITRTDGKNVPVRMDPNKGLIINNNGNLCVSLAFKVITDPIRGTMVFVRVYSGTLKSGNTVYNSTTGEKFKIGKLVVMHANVPEETNDLKAGQIGVLTGTSAASVKTGDTLVTHSIKKDALKSFKQSGELNLRINEIEIPPPVFSAAIEPKTLGNKNQMEQALQQITTEDPSLKITRDEETGQTLLNGMGELHLEIARDRLLNDLNAQINIGKVMVSYKETINKKSEVITKTQEPAYKLSMSVEPSPQERNNNDDEIWYSLGGDNNYFIMNKPKDKDKEWIYQTLSQTSFVNALISSCIVALQRGGKTANFPLHSIGIRLLNDWELPIDVSDVSTILSLSRSAICSALDSIDKSSFAVLEPLMAVKISVLEQDLGNVVQDLTGARKAQILSIEDENGATDSGDSNDDVLIFQDIANKMYLPLDHTNKNSPAKIGADIIKVIDALVPLGEMVAYMNRLRSLTQGRGSFVMEYHGMEKVSDDRLACILEDY